MSRNRNISEEPEDERARVDADFSALKVWREMAPESRLRYLAELRAKGYDMAASILEELLG